MTWIKLQFIVSLIAAVNVVHAAEPSLARPSPAQYAWHEQERIMFVCIGVATWMGTEYDEHGNYDLTKLNPTGLDADEICQAAELWGAREILFVAAHVGGFCWWPTDTTPYNVTKIPWKNGKGNLVKEMAVACRRRGLAIGLYLYPDDPRFAAKAIGRGGKTDDPAKQEEWNQLYRRQWEETLTLCGADLVREIWFDGSCQIPMRDIFNRLAPNAVILQSPAATIRWVGNEAGIARDPNWNTLKRSALESGGATQDQSAPDGDAWAPVECDTPLYDHNWFWNAGNERKRKSLAQLLNLYVQSVGRGSVLLLNSTPNTDGRIPEGDRARYRELGEALERNFGHPLAVATNVSSREVELDLGGAKQLNCADLWEDYRLGHRIRAYVVEGRVNGVWVKLAQGTAVGRRKLDLFAPVTADRVRVRVTQSVEVPVIRRFAVHHVDAALNEANVPPLGQGCQTKASTVHSAPYEARFLIDGDPKTRWGARDADPDPWVEIDFGRARKFAHASASELADRVRKFRIEYRLKESEPWRTAYEGTRIGNDWSADFSRVTAQFIRLHILEYIGPSPTLWEFQLRDRPEAWENAADWQGGGEITVDLSAAVNEAAQYEVRFVGVDGKPVAVDRATLLFEGQTAGANFLSGVGSDRLKLNRTQAVGNGASTALRVTLRTGKDAKGAVQIRPGIGP